MSLRLSSDLIRPLAMAGCIRNLVMLCPELEISEYESDSDDNETDDGDHIEIHPAQRNLINLVEYCKPRQMVDWPVGSLLPVVLYALLHNGKETAKKLIELSEHYFCKEEIEEVDKLMEINVQAILAKKFKGKEPVVMERTAYISGFIPEETTNGGIRATQTPHSLFVLSVKSLAKRNLSEWENETARMRGIGMHPLSLKSELIRPMTFAGSRKSLTLLFPSLEIHGYPEWSDDIEVVYNTFKEYKGDWQMYSATDDATNLVLFCWEHPMREWPVGSLLLMSFHFLYGGGKRAANDLLRVAQKHFCWEEIDEARKLIHLDFHGDLEMRFEGLTPTKKMSLGIVLKDEKDPEEIPHTITPHSLFTLAARSLAMMNLHSWELQAARIREMIGEDENKKKEDEMKKEEEQEKKEMEEMADEESEESEFDEEVYFSHVPYDDSDDE